MELVEAFGSEISCSVFADWVLERGAETETGVSSSVSVSVTADLHVSTDSDNLTFFFIDKYTHASSGNSSLRRHLSQCERPLFRERKINKPCCSSAVLLQIHVFTYRHLQYFLTNCTYSCFKSSRMLVISGIIYV